MANSKSNIYPVQLQNAELNLNKYDAEIKQYSGFNKNNAPFVGGCLSNIFTKDEAIAGANGENVYIDDNGDVYKAEGHSLTKNGNQVLTFNEDKFFVQNELKFDENPVKVISDKLYVVEEVNADTSHSYYLKSKAGNFTVGGNEVEKILITTCPEGNVDDFEKIPLNSITAIFVTKEDKVYCFVGGITSIKPSDVGVNNLWCIDVDNQETFGGSINLGIFQEKPSLDTPFCLMYDDESDQISYSHYFLYEDTAFLTLYSVDYINKSFTYLRSYSNFSNIPILSSGQKFVSNYLQTWCFLNYPYNKMIVAAGSSYSVSDSTAFKCVTSLESPYYDSGLKFRQKNVCNYYESIKYIGNYIIKKYVQTDGTISQFLVAIDSQMIASLNQDGSNGKCYVVHSTSGYDYAWGFGDISDMQISGSTPVKRYKYNLGDFLPLGSNFYLAVNNNQFSALCGENVLLTEWNSIDIKTLMFYSDKRDSSKINSNYDERVYYKLNDKWYEARLAETPSIQKFENQLVVNVDSMTNSFDIKRQKNLHFASCLNSIDIVDKYIVRPIEVPLYPLIPTPSSIYMGFAVNEYNQKDNSSIILNPIHSPYENFTTLIGNFNSNDKVNVYLNLDGSSKITYMLTIEKGSVALHVNPDLVGLPFPIDSNGNVEYNVNLFSKIKSVYGNNAFISSGLNSYPLVVGNNNQIIMNYYLASGVENLEELFIIQGQFYGIIGKNLFSMYYQNGVIAGVNFIVSVENLQFCGNTPYEALFFSKTNRCLYSFTGANILNQKQLVDKISVVKSYKYNPATQSIFLLTDIGVIVSSLFGIYQIDMPEAENMFLLDNGVVLCDNEGNYRYIRYYKEDTDEDYIKQNIKLETCFYGMNNQTVTINDCLYMRLFSEEHEEGAIEVSATTLSLQGRVTEKTTFNIHASDWDAETHTIYLRYQPKTQRGLGVSFSIDSPFKIASMSVGSQADAILVDKISKGAINAPFNNQSSTIDW